MKKAILLLISITTQIALHALNYSIGFDPSDIEINTTSYNEHIYSIIKYNGLANTGAEGQPYLPVKQLKFSIPYNAINVNLSVNTSKPQTISLNSPILNVFNELDSDVSKSSLSAHLALKPELAKIDYIGYLYGSHKILSVNIYPLIIGSDNNKNAVTVENDGKVVIAKNGEVSIHTTGYTFIDNLLQLNENSTLNIYCDKDVEIDNVYVPKGAKLIINARFVAVGDYGIQKHNEGYVELISREIDTAQKVRGLSQASNKLAVKGRTWWYEGVQGATGNIQEFGVTIGEEVTLNGEKWNEINVCKYTEPYKYDATEKTIVTDSTTIAYIKDDGVNVCAIKSSIDPVSIIKALEHNFELWDSPFNLYTFGSVGDHGYYGAADNRIPYRIEEVNEITNSGYNYNYYRAFERHSSDKLYIRFYGDSHEYISGIGHPIWFFLSPHASGCDCIAGWDKPELKYVTEGEDNHIIYTGKGGEKLWEIAGVEDVTIDSSRPNAPVEYYNLQGQRITEPAAGSTVIRRQGTSVSKVVVK